MGQRGRKSKGHAAAELQLVEAVVERLPPPQGLTAAQRAVWLEVTGSMPADWFCAANSAVLRTYCVYAVEAERLDAMVERCLADDGQVDEYVKLVRTRDLALKGILQASTKIRITPQHVLTWRGNRKAEAKGAAWEPGT